MGKLGAALCAAGCLVAGHANATIMLATIDGYFDATDTSGLIGPAGIRYSYPDGSFVQGTAGTAVTVTFDTTLGQLQTLPQTGGGSYQTLTWNISTGDPDPVSHVSLGIHTNAQVGLGFNMHSVLQDNSFDLGQVQSFSLTISESTGFDIQLNGSNGSFSYFEGTSPLILNGRVDQPYSLPVGGNTLWGGGNITLPGFGSVSSPFISANLSVLGPSPGVPEPTTWALMLIGFFGLGAALRRKLPNRRAGLAALA